MDAPVKFPESGKAYKLARQGRISQERLAAAVGITRRHIIRIENGENRPKGGLRDAIADVLGVDPRTLPAAEDAHPFGQTTYGASS